MNDVDGSAFKFCSEVPSEDTDDDEEENEGENNSDIFNLEKDKKHLEEELEKTIEKFE